MSTNRKMLLCRYRYDHWIAWLITPQQPRSASSDFI